MCIRDSADTIEGNCDTTLFLGGKEKTTLKEIAEILGKETIDLYNTSDTRGSQRSYGMNYQKIGKELMSQDEDVYKRQQYNQYKPIHKQLAKVKPEKREQFEQRHSRELILYDAAVRYLKDLKDSGEGIKMCIRDRHMEGGDTVSKISY